MKKILFVIAFVVSIVTVTAQEPADFYLPGLFGDHAVMKQNSDVRIWGWAPDMWNLKIVCSWAPNDTIRPHADKYNYWETTIRTPKEEGPHSMKYFGWNGALVREVNDILMGEPWLCSGQSNMEYCFRWNILDVANRDSLFHNPKIRVFRVAKASSRYPVERIEGQWEIPTKDVMDYFSVVAYFFGESLCQGLGGVPVGLIGSYWGGTPAEAWIDNVSFENPSLARLGDKCPANWPPTANASLYNAMIYPLRNYTLSGVIWYQGEANNDRAADYSRLLTTLINGWRREFRQPDLPFYFVQIAPYSGYASINGALLREQQQLVADRVPNTAITVIGDLVNDLNDVHPSIKRQVGERLAGIALTKTYGRIGTDPFSPRFKSYETSGSNAIVRTTAGASLANRGNDIPHFEILDADGNLHTATARLKKNGDIVISAKGVKQPAGVRYCFINAAKPTLFGANGLPLAPFRTDSVVIGSAEPISAGTLRFQDGRFKVMQLTDLHLTVGDGAAERNDSTCILVDKLIKQEKPGVVILTGDIVWMTTDALPLWKQITDVFVANQTPFAVTFGNHDEETNLRNDDILEYLKTCPYNLTTDTSGTSGSGNCYLPVLSSDGNRTAWVLYLFDSHNNRTDRTFGYYNWIQHDQIDWYLSLVDRYASENEGVTVPSIAFFHIPFYEYESQRWSYPSVGSREEGVYGPNVNSGLFESFINKGDVAGVFVGHDHNNDYIIDVNGRILLGYGRKTGYNSAYKEVLPRGARIINLRENERAFDTHLTDLGGDSHHYFFEQKNNGCKQPLLNGTFGQCWLTKNWNQERWDKEMKMLRDSGMHYFIFGNALETSDRGVIMAGYPAKHLPVSARSEAIERCLKAAQKYGIRVFVGMSNNARWFKFDYSPEWLNAQMEDGNRAVSDIVALYGDKYPDALYGWYWPWEVDNLNWQTPERKKMLVDALNVTFAHLDSVAPGKPLMLSPFANAAVGADAVAYGAFWTDVFKDAKFRIGDIFAPQDGIGAGGLNLENLGTWMAEYRKAVNTSPGIKLWANIELFQDDGAAPLERVLRQMQIVDSYASNIISFAYTHHWSPLEGKTEANAQYRDYLSGRTSK